MYNMTMENIFRPKQVEKKEDTDPKMEMRSLSIDKEKIKEVEAYFLLKSLFQGSNTSFLTSVSNNQLVGISSISKNSTVAEVVKKVLNNELDGLSRIRGVVTNGGSDLKIPEQLRVSISKLPKEIKDVLTKYTSSQFDTNTKPNVDEFDRIRREYAIQQSFWTLVDSKPEYNQLTQFISEIETQDDRDKKFIDQLNNYTLEYRRQNFLNKLFNQLSESNPNFGAILKEIKLISESASEKDKELLSIVNEITVNYELLSNKEEVIKSIDFNTPIKEALSRVDSLQIRPKTGGIDPISQINDLKEQIRKFYENITPLQSLDKVTSLRESYSSKKPEQILSEIGKLPESENYEIEARNILLREYEDYLSSKGLINSELSEKIKSLTKPIFDGEYNMVELGKNEPAKEYLMKNFSKTFFPLFQSLRSNPRFKNKLEDYIVGKDEGGIRKRLQFVQNLKELEKQRPLTDIERTYIESVEQLTKFNPYLVALSNEALGETDEYLRNHFDTLSKNTWDSLEDGSYVPALQIGTGPNGLAFFGEIARYRPDLAEKMLIVDIGNQPGGPFAIPNGPAWELNSANRRGPRQAVMPDDPGESEKKSVRAYGSPVSRWYPGERKADQNVRQGSINTTVDYFPTPDDLSTLRYPTNEELQIILATQSAMLFKQATFDTRLVKVVPNKNSKIQGDKIVTLEKINENGEKEIKKIYTDAIINSSGLGEPFYGFKIEGSQAEKIIQKTEDLDGFPKFSDTLTAFRALADRRNESMKPPRVIVMSGSGNSTDVLIEYLAELFASGNPQVRNVEKIYVIATGGLSQRPRYAKINDVKARNGKDNLIEFVQARIGDVGFKNSKTKDPFKEQVQLYDEKGQLIKNNDGEVILADAFIANTGFKPKFDEIYKSYLEKDESLINKSTNRPVDAITLPTNKGVSVADQLKKDPNILFIGTASNPSFNSVEKLSQLPVDAREALLRNGAENAVAIGFRAPDSQAAARIFIDKRDIELAKVDKEVKKEVWKMKSDTSKVKSWEVPLTIDPERLRIADNVYSEDDMLSSLVVYNLQNIEMLDQAGEPLYGEYKFEVIKGSDNNSLKIDYMENDKVNQTLVDMITMMLKNKYIQNYTISGFSKKRIDQKLRLVLKFRNGKIDPRGTAVQVG